MLLCEQNFRDVWSRNEIVRAEIGQILMTHAAKLVVAICISSGSSSSCKSVSSSLLRQTVSMALLKSRNIGPNRANYAGCPNGHFRSFLPDEKHSTQKV